MISQAWEINQYACSVCIMNNTVYCFYVCVCELIVSMHCKDWEDLIFWCTVICVLSDHWQECSWFYLGTLTLVRNDLALFRVIILSITSSAFFQSTMKASIAGYLCPLIYCTFNQLWDKARTCARVCVRACVCNSVWTWHRMHTVHVYINANVCVCVCNREHYVVFTAIFSFKPQSHWW